MMNGGVRCWGNNDYGQLGDGTTTLRLSPPTSNVLIGAQAIVASYGHHTCALMQITGGVRCWGSNLNGELGYGHAEYSNSPEQVIVQCQ
jgi:alpha-tubulin suppressor-like RCC1 family protein